MYWEKLFSLDDEIEICNKRNKLKGTKIFINDNLTQKERSFRLWRDLKLKGEKKVGVSESAYRNKKRIKKLACKMAEIFKKKQYFWNYLENYTLICLSNTWFEDKNNNKINDN